MKKEKINTITWAYFIGVVLVIVGHSYQRGNLSYPCVIRETVLFIYMFHMPLFFFLSGFLFYYSKGEGEWDRVAWIKNKCKLLLIPYIVWSVLAVVPKLILSMNLNSGEELSSTIMLKAAFSPREGVLGHFWFIPVLLILYLVGLLYTLGSRMLRYLVLGACVLGACFPLKVSWFAIEDICDNSIYYLLGMLCCKYLLDETNRLLKIPYMIGALLAAIGLYSVPELQEKRLCELLIALLMIYVVVTLTYSVRKYKLWLVEEVSENMLTIYIFSWPFQAAIELVTNRILQLHWVVVFVSTFIVGCLAPGAILCINHMLQNNIKNKKLKTCINLVLGVRK